MIEDLADLGESDFLSALGLVVANGEGNQLVLVLVEVGLQVRTVLRRVGGTGVPHGTEEDVDGLEVLFAHLEDVGDELPGQGFDRFGDELLLGLLAGVITGVCVFLLPGELERALFDGLLIDGVLG